MTICWSTKLPMLLSVARIKRILHAMSCCQKPKTYFSSWCYWKNWHQCEVETCHGNCDDNLKHISSIVSFQIMAAFNFQEMGRVKAWKWNSQDPNKLAHLSCCFYQSMHFETLSKFITKKCKRGGHAVTMLLVFCILDMQDNIAIIEWPRKVGFQ